MKRSRAFHPAVPDRLEGRMVLSQVYFSPVTGIIASGKSVHAAVARNPRPPMFQTVSQTKLADGTVETIDESSAPGAVPGTFTSKVIHEPDGTTQTESETATTSGLTTTFIAAITLPDGAHQTETGTDVRTISSATLLPDGTLQPTPGPPTLRTSITTFNHQTTQPGLGTETIVGTTVQGFNKRRSITLTDQQETHFDGSRDEVKLMSTEQNGTTTTHKSVILPSGAITTTVSTTKLQAAKIG